MKKILFLGVLLTLTLFSNSAFAKETESLSNESINIDESDSVNEIMPVAEETGSLSNESINIDESDSVNEIMPAAEETESLSNESINIDESDSVNEIMPAAMFLWYLTWNEGYVSKVYGSWRDGVSGSGKATLRLSKSVKIANSYTGSLTASKSDVSATVGFNITEEFSITTSYSVQVPAKKKYMIQWRPVYKKYKVRQDAYSGGTSLGSKYIYPKKYNNIEYRYITIK